MSPYTLISWYVLSTDVSVLRRFSGTFIVIVTVPSIFSTSTASPSPICLKRLASKYIPTSASPLTASTSAFSASDTLSVISLTTSEIFASAPAATASLSCSVSTASARAEASPAKAAFPRLSSGVVTSSTVPAEGCEPPVTSTAVEYSITKPSYLAVTVAVTIAFPAPTAVTVPSL